VSAVSIIGIGLIGGSIAAGLKSAGWHVVGYDPDPDVAALALDLDLIDRVVASIDEAVAVNPDLIVVAAPPTATIEIVAALATDQPVMDVASVKQSIVDVAAHLPGFVGTHPMAGRETSGPRAASPALFQGASWVVTGGADTNAARIVSDVIETLGAAEIRMSPDEHDRAVALISHVPHLVAGALLAAVEDDPHALDLAAGSFRDLTRVAASMPVTWVEILKSNDGAVLAAIGRLREQLATLEAAVVTEDDSLLGRLSDARSTRQTLGSPVAQVRIALADRPGELAKVGHAFESSGVDIRDIQMRHAPHGGGGVLTLSVRPGEEGSLVLALENEGLLVIP
jgi:prephenate dehydrogenase